MDFYFVNTDSFLFILFLKIVKEFICVRTIRFFRVQVYIAKGINYAKITAIK